jgi:hypothetical protein
MDRTVVLVPPLVFTVLEYTEYVATDVQCLVSRPVSDTWCQILVSDLLCTIVPGTSIVPALERCSFELLVSDVYSTSTVPFDWGQYLYGIRYGTMQY